jgi:hypothetical protein
VRSARRDGATARSAIAPQPSQAKTWRPGWLPQAAIEVARRITRSHLWHSSFVMMQEASFMSLPQMRHRLPGFLNASEKAIEIHTDHAPAAPPARHGHTGSRSLGARRRLAGENVGSAMPPPHSTFSVVVTSRGARPPAREGACRSRLFYLTRPLARIRSTR